MKLVHICLLLAALLCNQSSSSSLVSAIDANVNANADGQDKNCVVQENGEVVCKEEKASADTYYDDDDDDLYFGGDDDDEFDEDDDLESPVVDVNCKDNHEQCAFWASKGECDANPNYMLNNCKVACNNCASDKVKNNKKAQKEEKERLLEEIQNYGVHQVVDSGIEHLTMMVIRKSLFYMKNFVHAEHPTHKLSKDVIEKCRNHDSLCAFWAASGECDVNISFMTTRCAPSCQSCANIDFNTRCPKRPADAKPALKPGGMNVMFQNIVDNAPGNQTDETQLFAREKKVQENGTPYYTVNVLSRPKSPTATADDVTGVIPTDQDRDKVEDPWVVTFDNFLTEEECDHLIKLGHENVFKRSKDVGRNLDDFGSFDAVESKGRTSENAWCDEKSGCRNDPIALRIMERISNVTKIDSQNFEDYQILKYEEGQFYREHHDFIEHQVERNCGPRILTFFLYLNDVEEGGGTGLRVGKNEDQYMVVSAKKGKALLWPSALNFNPLVKDFRTRHEAIAVQKGIKYGANVWIHQYDVVETQRRGCT